MVIDMKDTVPLDTPGLGALIESEHTFVLTGSHYFGCARPESDIDFMVQDSPEVRRFLASIGFLSLCARDYEASEFRTGDTVESGNVQVQLVDLPVMRKARDVIFANFAEQHRTMDKFARDWFWDQAASLAVFALRPAVMF